MWLFVAGFFAFPVVCLAVLVLIAALVGPWMFEDTNTYHWEDSGLDPWSQL